MVFLTPGKIRPGRFGKTPGNFGRGSGRLRAPPEPLPELPRALDLTPGDERLVNKAKAQFVSFNSERPLPGCAPQAPYVLYVYLRICTLVRLFVRLFLRLYICVYTVCLYDLLSQARASNASTTSSNGSLLAEPRLFTMAANL